MSFPAALCLAILGMHMAAANLPEVNTNFAFDIYHALDKQTDGNMFFSPVSISMAMAMVAEGAGGDTRQQIDEVLGFDSLDLSTKEEVMQLMDVFNSEENNYTLNMANRLFGRSGYDFRQEFIDTTEEYYDAELEELDFAGDADGSRVHINEWVASRTNDKIQNLLKEGTITRATIMALVNAIYFKGLWAHPFDEERTTSETFHYNNNEATDMDMMFVSARLKYKELPDINAKFLELPYIGANVAMYIILPNEIEGLAGIEENLNGKSFNRLFKGMRPQTVDVKLPKFEMTQELNLGGVMEGMGVTDAFDPVNADFTGMAENDDGLAVSEIVHKAFISVDEEGTEAAASTAAIITLTSIQHTFKFTVDRPFMFVIREIPTGSILFMGRMKTSPEETPVIGTFGLTASDNNPNTASTTNSLGILIILLIATVLFY